MKLWVTTVHSRLASVLVHTLAAVPPPPPPPHPSQVSVPAHQIECRRGNPDLGEGTSQSPQDWLRPAEVCAPTEFGILKIIEYGQLTQTRVWNLEQSLGARERIFKSHVHVLADLSLISRLLRRGLPTWDELWSKYYLVANSYMYAWPNQHRKVAQSHSQSPFRIETGNEARNVTYQTHLVPTYLSERPPATWPRCPAGDQSPFTAGVLSIQGVLADIAGEPHASGRGVRFWDFCQKLWVSNNLVSVAMVAALCSCVIS